ncbi:MAG: hypothetical protein E5Y63_30580 [Mesorhizobium sp.]|nr:MAG: hypothetical protein E5Y63_30580 [Mesorhizobium sp.]
MDRGADQPAEAGIFATAVKGRGWRRPGVVVLFAGKELNQPLAVLHKYNIPEPVTGALLSPLRSVCLFSGIKVDFDLTARDILLVYFFFFTVIGPNAHVGDLARGGRPLAILLAVTVAFHAGGERGSQCPERTSVCTGRSSA